MFKVIKGVCSSCEKDGYIEYKAKMLCRVCNFKRKVKMKKDRAEFLGEDFSEADMYRDIWSARPHVSFLSGKNLDEWHGTQRWYSLFAHVLNKGHYTKYKFYQNNIILLTPLEHTLLDHGTQDQRDNYAKKNGCDWGVIYELKERLRSQYPNL